MKRCDFARPISRKSKQEWATPFSAEPQPSNALVAGMVRWRKGWKPDIGPHPLLEHTLSSSVSHSRNLFVPQAEFRGAPYQQVGGVELRKFGQSRPVVDVDRAALSADEPSSSK